MAHCPKLSIAHRLAPAFDEKEFIIPKDKYEQWGAYANSKIANLFFMFELGRRLESNGITGVTAVACHPGSTRTNLITAPVEKSGLSLADYLRITRNLPIFQSAAMGALPTLYAAYAPGVKNGEFYGPEGFQAMWVHPALEEPSKQSKSVSAAQKVWKMSELLTGTLFPIRK